MPKKTGRKIMDNELTQVEIEMDLIHNWLDRKSTYEVWELLPSHLLKELIIIILKDNKEEIK